MPLRTHPLTPLLLVALAVSGGAALAAVKFTSTWGAPEGTDARPSAVSLSRRYFV